MVLKTGSRKLKTSHRWSDAMLRSTEAAETGWVIWLHKQKVKTDLPKRVVSSPLVGINKEFFFSTTWPEFIWKL